MKPDPMSPRGPRSGLARTALTASAILAFAVFACLGTWQVKRLAWKLDLIERVDQRVHAPAVDAPGPDDRWPAIDAATMEYRHVRLVGTYLHDHETLVQAVTNIGSGFWVLTPLRQLDGTLVLVNRGFVPPEARERSARTATQTIGQTTVTGLLRLSEPGGGFLRHNDAAAKRWFSRDVQAIAKAQNLQRFQDQIAPYFVDADATPASSAVASTDRKPDDSASTAWPVGGLTVVSFQNNHLVYAITWYALALMVAGASWYVRRTEPRWRPAPSR